jgi:hypothetical protein
LLARALGIETVNETANSCSIALLCHLRRFLVTVPPCSSIPSHEKRIPLAPSREET